MTLKEQYFEKVEWGIIHRPWKNNLQILFFRYKFLSAYLENTQNGEKSIKILHILENNRIAWKKFRSSLSILDKFHQAKNLSHATVPLTLNWLLLTYDMYDNMLTYV